MKKYNIAVVGATGVVGNEMVKTLEQRKFPVNNLLLLASERSAGKELDFKDSKVAIETLSRKSFLDIDIALFSAGGSISEKYAPCAVECGTTVIDNSSFFRMHEDVPLVVPEVNPDEVLAHKGIIANPNCSTIQMVVVLKPIHDVANIERVVVSTYQAVSGTGKAAMEELSSQSRSVLDGVDVEGRVYPHQIAFNVLPHIDSFLDDGYTKEEHKMVNETKKIMGDQSIKVTATTVRVPVFVGHAESINIQTSKHLSVAEVKNLLTRAAGVKVIDNPKQNAYPLPVDAAGKDDCFVGRIRLDTTIANGLNLWVVADNLRKGAALNAVQIAELLVKE